jgi:hypothetical protein
MTASNRLRIVIRPAIAQVQSRELRNDLKLYVPLRRDSGVVAHCAMALSGVAQPSSGKRRGDWSKKSVVLLPFRFEERG